MLLVLGALVLWDLFANQLSDFGFASNRERRSEKLKTN
jgi:hypothetical protein